MREIDKYSNPLIVRNAVDKYLGKDIQLYLSTRKDKKYMIFNPKTNKWIHFGQIGYEDYTKHQDDNRREKFRNRNKSWKNSKKWTPAWLSYYILW